MLEAAWESPIEMKQRLQPLHHEGGKECDPTRQSALDRTVIAQLNNPRRSRRGDCNRRRRNQRSKYSGAIHALSGSHGSNCHNNHWAFPELSRRLPLRSQISEWIRTVLVSA